MVVALITLFVLLPLAGLATTAYVRQGVLAELQMAADSGALAGAASIPLGDFDDLLEMTDPDIPPPPDGPPEPPPPPDIPGVPDVPGPGDIIPPRILEGPLRLACEQALAAVEANGNLGDASTTREGRDDDVECTATYLPDTAFAARLGDCVDLVVEQPDHAIAPSLRHLLPGLVSPGIQVEMARQVRGPFESLVDPENEKPEANEQSTAGRARRRFKNALVLPVIFLDPIPNPIPPLPDPIPPGSDPLVPGQEIDLRETTREEALAALQQVRDTFTTDFDGDLPAFPLLPQECSPVFDALADDFVDVANPPEGAPDPEVIMEEAARQNVPAILLALGPTFFDFVPICVSEHGEDFRGLVGCGANAPGGFRSSLVP